MCDGVQSAEGLLRAILGLSDKIALITLLWKARVRKMAVVGAVTTTPTTTSAEVMRVIIY
jgi:hypothetical protein